MAKQTIDDLKQLKAELAGQYTEKARAMADLLDTEIRRRQRAGRPAESSLTRKEQNRLAQQRYRAKKRLTDKPK